MIQRSRKIKIRKPNPIRPRIGVVDYGMGNLRSVSKSLEASGARVFVANKPSILSKSDILVVPGVGAFGDAMAALRRKGLDRFIRRWVNDGRPYFGICLGLQLLFESSDESPETKGLGLLRGRVRRFKMRDRRLKVPHMGWNNVLPARGRKRDEMPPLGPKPYFYFVHSFVPEPLDREVIWLETIYGKRFCAAVAQGNLISTQFHPEKSGEAGLLLLKSILKRLSVC